jgi:protein-S-isoprenylcysteine O-methyltransferase Ste14
MTLATEPMAAHPLDTKVPPPILAVLVAAYMWVIAHVGSTFGQNFALRTPIAIAFAVAAATFGLSAFGAFRRASTTIDPVHIDRASSLVTSGVFRLTRNPMYVALTALLMSWAIVLAAFAALTGPVLFVLYITRFQIVPEERVMRSKFGASYGDYTMRTRRWL